MDQLKRLFVGVSCCLPKRQHASPDYKSLYYYGSVSFLSAPPSLLVTFLLCPRRVEVFHVPTNTIVYYCSVATGNREGITLVCVVGCFRWVQIMSPHETREFFFSEEDNPGTPRCLLIFKSHPRHSLFATPVRNTSVESF